MAHKIWVRFDCDTHKLSKREYLGLWCLSPNDPFVRWRRHAMFENGFALILWFSIIVAFVRFQRYSLLPNGLKQNVDSLSARFYGFNHISIKFDCVNSWNAFCLIELMNFRGRTFVGGTMSFSLIAVSKASFSFIVVCRTLSLGQVLFIWIEYKEYKYQRWSLSTRGDA